MVRAHQTFASADNPTGSNVEVLEYEHRTSATLHWFPKVRRVPWYHGKGPYGRSVISPLEIRARACAMWLNRRKNIPIEHRSLEFLAEPPSPGSFLTQDLHEGPEATSSAEGVTASSPAPSLSEVVIDSDYATDEEHAPVPFISRRTTPEQVVFHLTDCNCKDLSSSIDHANCSEFPIFRSGFSDIYRGRLQDGTEVAIKLLRYSEDSEDDSGTEPKHFRRAAQEIYAWGKCVHPNVAPLLGLSSFRGRIGIVSAWMGKGNLSNYLKKTQGVDRHHLCVQISDALTYLHKNGVIHGDLKGANILVSDAGTPVLTDFGSSFLTAATLNFTTTGKGCSFTTRWSAPEIIDETSQHTEASDVYALGMTIYEIMTGKPPYHNKRESNVIRLVTVKREPPERLECLRGDCEKSESLWQLLLRCWSFEPAKRPSAAEVADTLKIMLI